MSSFTKTSIQNLKEQINIVDVIGRDVKLRKAGANYSGLCPFHSEKTPSFMVSEERQYFTCFGCGAKGDVFEFVQKFHNIGFSEAAEKLADEYGVKLERTGTDREEKFKKYYEVNRLAADFFYKSFTRIPNPGFTYMRDKREIEPRILKKFGIGYADSSPDSLYRYMSSKGIDEKILIDLGLCSRGREGMYDFFRDRVMFPIISTTGKVIGFGGRALADNAKAKYLNSRDTPVFQKRNNLYGLNITRGSAGKAGFMIMVEGYMDMISLFRSGVENVCATLGTALTENQARLLGRYTKNVVLSYDADSAGRKNALRGIEILRKENLNVKVLHVPEGKDPDEYVRANSGDAFLGLVREALPYAEYKLASARGEFNLGTSEGRIGYLKKAAVILSGLEPVEEDEYIRKVSRDMNISEEVLRREIRQISEKTGRGNRRGRTDSPAYGSGNAVFTGRAGEKRGNTRTGNRRLNGKTDGYGSGDDSGTLNETATRRERTLLRLLVEMPEYLYKLSDREDIFITAHASEYSSP